MTLSDIVGIYPYSLHRRMDRINRTSTVHFVNMRTPMTAPGTSQTLIQTTVTGHLQRLSLFNPNVGYDFNEIVFKTPYSI